MRNLSCEQCKAYHESMSFRAKEVENSKGYSDSFATSSTNLSHDHHKHRNVHNTTKKNFIYILKLIDNFWYVGTTTDPKSRLAAHRSGDGAEWTRQLPPIGGFFSLKEVKGDEGQAKIEEDAEVKRLMKEHGIEMVRGGSYSSVSLSRTDVKALTKELRHASGGCLRCGRKNHWAKDCYANKDVAGNPV